MQQVVATITGTVMPAQPANAADGSLAPAIAKEAAWLKSNGWPLYALVERFSAGAPLDEQANCIAVAVYHEARGETLEGQLAVAKVIMNRAASGKYPSSLVRHGQAAVAILVRQSAHRPISRRQ